jgi:hypothetical protein
MVPASHHSYLALLKLQEMNYNTFFIELSIAGMSNWRPAGRMWPNCLINAARCDLFKINCHLKL